MTSDLYFIINVFNVIIISIDNFICALLYAIEWVYRLLSLKGSTISQNGLDRTGPNSHSILRNGPDELDIT